MHSAFNLGGAFIAARLNDAFRDVQQIIPFVFRLLVYVSGVMFPIDDRLANADVPPLLLTAVQPQPDRAAPQHVPVGVPR